MTTNPFSASSQPYIFTHNITSFERLHNNNLNLDIYTVAEPVPLLFVRVGTISFTGNPLSMSKSSKLSSTFKSRRFTDIPITASNKHTLSAILNKAHNNEEEVEKSLDELRCFILEKSLINLTEVECPNINNLIYTLMLIGSVLA
jgi:hypothetical protein